MKFLLRAGLPLALAIAAMPVRADTIGVAVAANLQPLFEDLRAAWARDSGHDAKATFNSSGKFVAQIVNGAPFDVFMSADTEFPERLHAGGQAAAPVVYAKGALIVWSMKPLPAADWKAALTAPDVAKIAIANPQTAPYGREAMRALERAGLADRLRPRLVYGESISQTNQFIHTRAADVGLTAKSTVYAAGMKGQGQWVELPKDVYHPIAQSAVVLRHGESEHREAARAFVAFLASPAARAVFARYGYDAP